MIELESDRLRRRWERSMWLAIVIGIGGAISSVIALIAFALEPNIWKFTAAVLGAAVALAETVCAMACDVLRRGAGP